MGVVGRAGHNQHAVAVVLVAGAALGERAVQRVVDVGRTTIAQQVARRVVAEAHHLVGRIVVVSRADPVDRRAGAVAHQVVGVAVARRAALDGANQPAETVVVIGDRARGDQADGIEQDMWAQDAWRPSTRMVLLMALPSYTPLRVLSFYGCQTGLSASATKRTMAEPSTFTR